MTQLFRSLNADLAAFLSILLIASSMHKVFDRSRLLNSTRRLLGVSGKMAGLALVAAMTIEAASGLAIASAYTIGLAAAVASLLWSGYVALIWRAKAAGRTRFDCGCSFGRARGQFGRFAIFRNTVLIAAAVGTGVTAQLVGPMSIGPVEVLTGVALFTQYLAIDQIATLSTARSVEA
jgi:hypothetical protein